MPLCIVSGCNSHTDRKKKNITFHSFPNDEELQKKWFLAINKVDCTLSKFTRICSLHFSEEDIDRSLDDVQIKENAVPQLFLHVALPLEKSCTVSLMKQQEDNHLNQPERYQGSFADQEVKIEIQDSEEDAGHSREKDRKPTEEDEDLRKMLEKLQKQLQLETEVRIKQEEEMARLKTQLSEALKAATSPTVDDSVKEKCLDSEVTEFEFVSFKFLEEEDVSFVMPNNLSIVKCEDESETTSTVEENEDQEVSDVFECKDINMKTYVCIKCSQRFRSSITYNRHIEKPCSGPGLYECILCNKHYTCKKSLQDHVCRVHSSAGEKLKSLQPLIRKEIHRKTGKKLQCKPNPKDSEAVIYECTICDKRYTRKKSWQAHNRRGNHMKPGEKLQPKPRKKILSNLNPTRADIFTKAGALPLDQLKRKMKQKILYKKYDKVETFICDLCGKILNHRSSLYCHKKYIHFKIKPYHCEYCGKNFVSSTELKNHQNSVHLNLKNYICEKCGKGFSTRILLQDHWQVHLDMKPYPCQACGRSFKRMSYLTGHACKASEAKKYECTHCSRQFKGRSSLYCHKRKCGEKQSKTETGEG